MFLVMFAQLKGTLFESAWRCGNLGDVLCKYAIGKNEKEKNTINLS